MIEIIHVRSGRVIETRFISITTPIQTLRGSSMQHTGATSGFRRGVAWDECRMRRRRNDGRMPRPRFTRESIRFAA